MKTISRISRLTLLAVAGTLGFAAAPAEAAAEAASALAAENLRCEYRINPVGLDVTQPRLNWTLASEQRGQRQTAFEILVASSPETLARNSGDLWTSGKVATDQTIHVAYGGQPLASRMRVWWKVRVWDKDGRPSAWSAPATWTMGLLQAVRLAGQVDRRPGQRYQRGRARPAQRLSQRDCQRPGHGQVGRGRSRPAANLRRRAPLPRAALRLAARHAGLPLPGAFQDRGGVARRFLRRAGAARPDRGRRAQSRHQRAALPLRGRHGAIRPPDRHAAGAAGWEQLCFRSGGDAGPQRRAQPRARGQSPGAGLDRNRPLGQGQSDRRRADDGKARRGRRRGTAGHHGPQVVPTGASHPARDGLCQRAGALRASPQRPARGRPVARPGVDQLPEARPVPDLTMSPPCCARAKMPWPPSWAKGGLPAA